MSAKEVVVPTICTVLATVSNILILIVIHKKKLYKKPAFLNICFLAYSDMILNLDLVIRLIILLSCSERYMRFMCKIAVWLGLQSAACSCCAILLMSMELVYIYKNVRVARHLQFYKKKEYALVCFAAIYVILTCLTLPCILLPTDESNLPIKIHCMITDKNIINQTSATVVTVFIIIIYVFVTSLLVATAVFGNQMRIFTKPIQVAPAPISHQVNTAQSSSSICPEQPFQKNHPESGPSIQLQSLAIPEVVSTQERTAKTGSRPIIPKMKPDECIYYMLNANLKQYRRQINTCVILIWLLFSITWLPGLVTFLLMNFKLVHLEQKYVEAIGSLITINCFANIFLYTWKSKDFRDGIKQLFLGKKFTA